MIRLGPRISYIYVLYTPDILFFYILHIAYVYVLLRYYYIVASWPRLFSRFPGLLLVNVISLVECRQLRCCCIVQRGRGPLSAAAASTACSCRHSSFSSSVFICSNSRCRFLSFALSRALSLLARRRHSNT